MSRDNGLGFRLIEGDDDYGVRRNEDGKLEFFGKTKINPFAIADELSRHILETSNLDTTGYFGGFTPMIAASIMQLQGEPLDPAFNPRWAEGVPNLSIEASVYRATSSYGMGPHKIGPAYPEPTIDSINELIDRFRSLQGGMPFEFVYEPYRLADNFNIGGHLIPPTFLQDLQREVVEPSLHDQIMADIRDEYVRQCDAELIGQVFDVPLCVLGVNCDHASHKKPDLRTRLLRRWYTFLGKARWARERFARRVYEFISEYEFEEEEVDW